MKKTKVADHIMSILDELRATKDPHSTRALARLVMEKLRGLPVDEGAKLRAAIQQLLLHQGAVPAAPLLFPIVTALVKGRNDKAICDPWAGMGALLAIVQAETGAKEALAITRNEEELGLGKVLVGSAQWEMADPLQVLSTTAREFGVVVSIPPFNMRSGQLLRIADTTGNVFELQDSLGNLLIVAASRRLTADGVGIFVVTPSFFFSQSSVFHRLGEVGIGVEAALALPAGTLAPYTNIQTYLIVTRKRVLDRIFVGQLSNEMQANLQIVKNLHAGVTVGPLDLGRYVDATSFTGLGSIRLSDRVKEAKSTFGAPSVSLGELATKVTFGRSGEGFSFPQGENAIYVPLIGMSDVVGSQDQMTLKAQNYSQVEIDPTRVNSRFVIKFLNSELGKEIREQSKTATFIPKLNTQALKSIAVFVPELGLQKEMLEIEAAIATERNIVLSLQNQLAEFQVELWSQPKAARSVRKRLLELSERLAGSVRAHAASDRMQWIETLPFPLASILRAWEATPPTDYKTRYEHLLHFFEASTEFLSIVFLSAFTANEALFTSHRQPLLDALKKQNLSFERATFGLWKVVLEYLGKRTRELLAESSESRGFCAEIFSDTTLELPMVISRKELAQILSKSNLMRNDWSGHGGVVGQTEAQLRHELLVGELEQMRSVFGDVWTRMQMIRALSSRFRRGLYENEVKLLVGSNTGFLTATHSMSTGMDVERIYLGRQDEKQALKLIPLIEMGPSPAFDNNAFYFFNRLEKDGARFISYHYAERPEFKGPFAEATETIRFLTSGNLSEITLLN